MFTLAVETSTHQGSLTLFSDNQIVDTECWSRVGSHSEFLTSSLQSILKKHSLSLQQLNRLAVGTGPGSFTGIRVGINFIRTLGYGLHLPIYSLNSLHLLASQIKDSSFSNIRVVQYAFRDLLYTGQYKLDQGRVVEFEKPSAVTAAQLITQLKEPTLILGSGAELLLSLASPKINEYIIRNTDFSDDPHSVFFQNTCALDKSLIHLTDWIHTIPLYIRASEAEEKMKMGN
ncbi:MAG: tRNA (adenosine(37)-N6)-threonylcarbamoyltransferase complex dimerization subunit type 1 TsaB [Bdellovibrionales bacterium]|nr:tRNA (adenosine(37)-N6)-threonylcarbamoyltransferase complex dimerization subunit type 1 TsaB [Bdellovibrionales bacterium]